VHPTRGDALIPGQLVDEPVLDRDTSRPEALQQRDRVSHDGRDDVTLESANLARVGRAGRLDRDVFRQPQPLAQPGDLDHHVALLRLAQGTYR
jgi:hypothetical protein